MFTSLLKHLFGYDPAPLVLPKAFKRDTRRPRVSLRARQARETAFENELAAEYLPPKHLKLARAAAMGTVGLPHGRRGLMVRVINGRSVITS